MQWDDPPLLAAGALQVVPEGALSGHGAATPELPTNDNYQYHHSFSILPSDSSAPITVFIIKLLDGRSSNSQLLQHASRKRNKPAVIGYLSII